MSDTPQGPGWWQASDEKWYPPPQPVMSPETTTVGQHQPPGPGATPYPYGGAPASPPGAGGQNRTALYITLGVLGVLVLVVLIAALSSGGDDDDPQAAPSTTASTEPVTTEEVETTEPPPDTTEPEEPAGAGDVSDLEVTETGFSTYIDPIGDTPGGSFGFLVENTGDATLTGVPLSVTIMDEAGGILETTSFDVGVIRPGETLGYGAELIEHPTNGIGEIEVQVGESVSTYEAPAEGTLTASDVNTTGDEYSVTTTFSVASTYSEQVDYAAPYAIHRDTSGRIIGGGMGIMDFIPPGGEQNGQVDIFGPIPNIATTEVYVDSGPWY
jgi:hypothetical protein